MRQKQIISFLFAVLRRLNHLTRWTLLGLTWGICANAQQNAEVSLHYQTELRADESLSQCLIRLKITDGDMYAAIENIEFAQALAALPAQTPVTLKADRTGKVHSLKIPLPLQQPRDTETQLGHPAIDEIPVLLFLRPPEEPTKFKALHLKQKAQVRIITKSAPFDGNFFNVMDRQEIPDAISEQLTRLFSGSVNFSRDLSHGASFTLKYEVAYLEENPVSTGKILYSAVSTEKDTYQAYWWQKSGSASGHYYSPNGEALSTLSWKTPILYSRKTSNFGMRFDPFTGNWANHQGVDIVAPLGTEVRATQQGKVKKVGWQGHYGNAIVLEHNNGFETIYGHLSGFAKIYAGQEIPQGTLIGFVGSTGRSTGPHLHYELRQHGRAINPEQSFRSNISRQKLTGEELERFVAYQDDLLLQKIASR